MEVDLKPVKWLGSSHEDLSEQREDIQRDLGYQLFRVQVGLMPHNYKPMKTVGTGTYEIRVEDADGIARLMYVAKFGDTVHVLHVFTKKTQKTSKADIELAKTRYKEAKRG